jgi:fatty-acyl-CoA synthase
MIVPLNEYDFLKRALAVYPDREAIVNGDLRLTYRQFGERVFSWARSMRGLDIRKGDRVAIISQNCHRLLDGFFGAPLIGAIYMPINFRLVASDFEYILNHGEAKGGHRRRTTGRNDRADPPAIDERRTLHHQHRRA